MAGRAVPVMCVYSSSMAAEELDCSIHPGSSSRGSVTVAGEAAAEEDTPTCAVGGGAGCEDEEGALVGEGGMTTMWLPI